MLKGKRLRLVLFVALCSFLGWSFSWLHVRPGLTSEDQTVLSEFVYLNDLPRYSAAASDIETLAQIKQISKAVFDATPHYIPIPQGQSREPKDVIAHGGGHCFDRSRLLEKLFTFLGFKVDHFALYDLEEHISKPRWVDVIVRLVRQGGASHSTVEVYLPSGKRVNVDSYINFVAEDNEIPYSLSDIREMSQATRSTIFKDRDKPDFYNKKFFMVRGLYSRHGMFYAPYVPFPDLDFFSLNIEY